MSETLYIGNDNEIELSGLADARGVYQNDALVNVTLKTLAGVNVAGQVWPLTLTYVTGSNGVYRGVLQDALVVTVNDSLRAHVDVTAGGLTAHFEKQVVVAVRKD